MDADQREEKAGPDTKERRVIVIGAGGRLGGEIVRHLHTLGTVKVMHFDRARLNLAAPHTISSALEHTPCDVMINAAGFTAVDDCESQSSHALLVNGTAPGELARWCSRVGARLIHFSTDYVFDGLKTGPYDEQDAPNPQSAYGRSKRVGEEQVLAAGDQHQVVRLSWLFGGARPAFPEWVLRNAADGEISVASDKISCPTYAPDVARWILPLMNSKVPGGIFHLCNPQPCSWWEWAGEILRLSGSPVIPRAISLDDLPGLVAPRPRQSALAVSKYETQTGQRCRPWQEALRDHLQAQS